MPVPMEKNSEIEIIRSLGFYQPFGSLMLHGKIETRWVRAYRKAPFPLGKYIFYTTKKPCDETTLLKWCGIYTAARVHTTLLEEPTKNLNGYAIGIGDLVDVTRILKDSHDILRTFVKGSDIRHEIIEGKSTEYHRHLLYFENVKRIEPFQIKGKQGVGILTPEQIKQIKIL